VKYINYIISYGAYGDGKGNNAGYCGIGEMWGNYEEGLFMNQVVPSVTVWNHLDDPDEDWYNPSFLEEVVITTPDLTVSEVFASLTSDTNTFSKLLTQLKSKTNNDEKIDAAFANPVYSDWS
jgi:hypothetical protein